MTTVSGQSGEGEFGPQTLKMALRLLDNTSGGVREILTGSLLHPRRDGPLQMGIICSSLGDAFVRAARIEILRPPLSALFVPAQIKWV